MRRILSATPLFFAFFFIAAAAVAEEPKFRPIFDGKSLQGWDGDPRLWRVEDGSIVGQTTAENPAKGNTFLIWRGGRPADFELKLEFKLYNHNSGVHFRSWEDSKAGKWVVGGYQADMDESGQWVGGFYEERGRGILARRGETVTIQKDHKPLITGATGDPAELLAGYKKGDWNSYEIIARGNRIVEKINGRTTVEVIDDDPEQRRFEGIIAFQLHAGPPMKVRFRDIQLKEYPTPGKSGNGGAGKKKIAFVAGRASHGYAEHEHCADCLLLADALTKAFPNVETAVHRDGWPSDPKAFDGADALVVISDGGKSHPMLRYLGQVEKLMRRGVGLACIHYAVAAPKEKGGEQLKNWIGANYEPFWSVNPFWTAEFKKFPDHPIARGLKPFAIEDEWYFNMRFIDGMEGVEPILTAVPPDAAREGPDGPSSGNPTVRSEKGKAEHVAWARQRPDGGRGFGLTGAHWHWNWANDNFRKTALNGIAWTAKLEIPSDGVPSKTPTYQELRIHLDKSEPEGYDRSKVQKMLDGWK